MEPPSPYSIPILNESPMPVKQSLLRRAIRATLSHHGMAAGTVSVLITTNTRIQELNREFRSIDHPTDVLTFPATPTPARSSRMRRMIGDIAISAEYAAAQAAVRGVSLDDEAAYLGIHGALHLCGFDDETEADQKRMQAAMAEIGQIVGLVPEEAWVSLLHSHSEATGVAS
jgi:probable rRNA maturation factor